MAERSDHDKNGGGIYVASRVVRAGLWLDQRKLGVPIIASWIDEAGEGETADFGELWERIRGEIAASKALVFYAAGVEDFPFKGALVEVGMALAMNKPVFACLENVMLDGRTMRPVGSWLMDRRVTICDTLEDAIRAAVAVPAPLSHEVTTGSRGAYEPLTKEQIESLRWLWANPLGGDSRFDILCNMAVNCLLYAEEIHRLRGEVGPSATFTTDALKLAEQWKDRADDCGALARSILKAHQ